MDDIALKRTFLSKLQRNGLYCIIGALLLLVGIPLYQFIILIPSGYSNALATQSLALHWINAHSLLFLGYRTLLFAGFACIISLPFTLFRIIVAQEILAREADEQVQDDNEEVEQEQAEEQTDNNLDDGLPSFAWRGKGFAVLAAWTGFIGLLSFALGTLVSTLYLFFSVASLPTLASNFDSAAPLTGFFAVITYTVGGGLLALSCLFFGVVIARSGLKLWPGMWIAFGYMGLALAVLFSVSAAEVVLAPGTGQSLITTLAILLFAVWALWFGIMLVRLKPE